MDGGGSRFSVRGCGPQRTEFSTAHGVRNYTICASAPADARLRLRKLTEAGPMWGPIVKVLMPQTVATLHAVFVTALAPDHAPAAGPTSRRIQIMGDSDAHRSSFGVAPMSTRARRERSMALILSRRTWGMAGVVSTAHTGRFGIEGSQPRM